MSNVRHGLTAQTMLPGESEEDWNELERVLREELEPEGILEEIELQRALSAEWRRRRAARAESGLILWSEAELVRASAGIVGALQVVADAEAVRAATDAGCSFGEPPPSDAVERVQLAREVQRSPLGTLGKAYANVAEVVEHLDRHEAALERSYSRAIAALRAGQGRRRMQAAGMDLQK